jgi:hypothetical protein
MWFILKQLDNSASLSLSAGHFLRIRQWGGGGGINKKGPYYNECGEMLDGLLVTKSLVWYRIY